MNFLTGKIIVKIDRSAYLNHSRIDISPNKTIKELKEEILNIYYKNKNLRHTQLELKFNSNVLSDNGTITSYGIRNNDILKLSIDYNTQEQTMIYKTFNINIERGINLADNLIVSFIHNERNQKIYCHKDKRISELKQLISNRTNITANRIKLKYNNQELDNHAKLYYYFNVSDTTNILSDFSDYYTILNSETYRNSNNNIRLTNYNVMENILNNYSNYINLESNIRLNTTRPNILPHIRLNTQSNTSKPKTQNRKISGRKINLRDNCPICISPLYCVIQDENKEEENDDIYSFTNCTHLIHNKCFEEYCKSDNYKDKCPMCNE